jgi:hydroxymethylpyrimidine/phosphomethylpyrimidine kinase
VTAQNTRDVADIFAMPPDVVRSQIESVLRDIPIDAVKTGMLATADIVVVVAETIGRMARPNLVVDPVMMASAAGVRTLLSADAVQTMKTRLLPIATVVTPNVDEATALSGIEVNSQQTAREAARRILASGPKAVVVKGGHLPGEEATDLLFDGTTFLEFSAPRSVNDRVHGTGCTFSAAIAAGLALGDDIPAAVQRAKTYVTAAIAHSVMLGDGARLMNHG